MNNEFADIKILVSRRKKWFEENLSFSINSDFLSRALSSWTDEDWIDYIIKTDSDIYEFSEDKTQFRLK